MKPFFLVAWILLAGLPVTAPAGRKSLAEQLKASPHRLVHETYHNNNWELFTRNADGSGERNLTNTPEVNELYPQVSPDGKRICFLVDTGRGRDTVRSLWLMNSDGTGRKKISDYARQPCWTADSNRLLWLPQEYKKWSVTDYFSKGLMYYDLRSGKSTPHPNSAKMHHLYNPTFSANGKWIASTVHAGMGFKHAILLIEADGNKIINLGISGCRPCLSPVGNHIAWGSGDHSIEVAEIDLDSDHPKVGKRSVIIRDKVNKIYHVDWSPGGKFVSFSRGPKGKGDLSKPGTYQSAREIVGVFADKWDIYAVSTSGKKEVDLQKTSSAADFLRLSKDGRSNKESDWVRLSK
ncbi:MAG: PD40 domain-containing protein [Roseibacillus sp.]|nr:PD40 domain-containing protein [Roseibacillus sp.]